jgi:hypothetical protein
MSTFTTPCKVEVIGSYRFKLLEPFEYHIGEYPVTDPKKIIRVPVGFNTNFASVPRIFWSILSPIDEYAKAAVIHDYLYSTGIVSKTEADNIFREAMEVLNTPKWKIVCVYWAVRLFGFFAWYRSRIRGY